MSSASATVENGGSEPMDEVPHAYDEEYENPYTYAHSEISAFDYDNKLNKAAMTSQRPNHYVLTVKDPKNPAKTARISVFDTDTNMGAPVCNAVTGIPYFSDDLNTKTHRVGSKYESTLFKARDIRGANSKCKALTLYYDGPSQCERHLLTKLPQCVHEKWHRRTVTNASTTQVVSQ